MKPIANRSLQPQVLRSAFWQRDSCADPIWIYAFFRVNCNTQSSFSQIRSLCFLMKARHPTFFFWSGLVICFFSSSCWWHNERYCLQADEDGILQRTGFRTNYVLWSDVTRYRLETLKGTKEFKIEPVLYNEEDRVLLRPVAPLFVGTARMDEERERFWEYVQSQLSGKHSKSK